MVNTNSMRYCNLADEEGFDKFAHLDTLRMVIAHTPDEELVKILKGRSQGGCRDWPVRGCSMCSMPA